MNYRYFRKSSGILYQVFHPLIALEFRMLFRKIYFHNQKGVPPNKPVLIASNHPTAFVDPLFFCIFLEPPVYNMTRGDIFRKPLFRKLMESCNMFPVYRRRDGYGERDRNDEVFEYCEKKLRNDCTINIFVEGEHHLDKRLLPLQKGIARIAFGTYQNQPLEDLQIIPIGCNYVAGDTTRDEVKIVVGDPIFIRDYWSRYRENAAAATNQLCQDIRTALLRVCYHIDNRNDDELADQLLTLWRNDHPSAYIPVLEHDSRRFFAEKEMLDRMNSMPAVEKESLKEKAGNYFASLEQAGLTDESIQGTREAHWSWIIFFVVAAAPALAGYLVSWPIRSLARYLARTRVKKKEYYTSILIGVNTVFNLLYYILLLLTGFWLGWQVSISLVLLMPVITWLSIFWFDRWKGWNAARKALQHPDREKLLALRRDIRY